MYNCEGEVTILMHQDKQRNSRTQVPNGCDPLCALIVGLDVATVSRGAEHGRGRDVFIYSVQ